MAAGLGSSHEASERVRQAMVRWLAMSEGRLCEHHALRIRARRLLAHALGELQHEGEASKSLCRAIEACLEDRRLYRPAGHPGIVHYERWLARLRGSQK